MHKLILPAVLMIGLSGPSAHAAPVSAPIPFGVGVAIVVVPELVKPKPFCKVIKIFKRKSRC